MPDFADVTPLLYRHERQERVVPDTYGTFTQQRIRQYERHGGYSSYLLNGPDASVRWSNRHEPRVDTSASSPSLTFPQPYASKPTVTPPSTDASTLPEHRSKSFSPATRFCVSSGNRCPSRRYHYTAPQRIGTHRTIWFFDLMRCARCGRADAAMRTARFKMCWMWQHLGLLA